MFIGSPPEAPDADLDTPGPGQQVKVEITDLSAAGEGVGRTAAGLVVMVAGAVPGDLAVAAVTAMERSLVRAELISLERSSRHRVEPRCRHFGTCGGCVLQQLEVGAQRRAKGLRLRELLRRTGGIDPGMVGETVAVGADLGYRSRIEFSLEGRGSATILGMHGRDRSIFKVEECLLPHPALMETAQRLASLVNVPGMRLAGRADLRRSSLTGEVLLGLTLRSPVPAGLDEHLAPLAGGEGRATTAVLLEGTGRRERRRILWGQGEIWEEAVGVRFPIKHGVFVQTHSQGMAALYADVLDWLSGGPGPLLELYAGMGILSQAAAAGMGSALAVEESSLAVAAGRRAAARNRRRVRFRRGGAMEVAGRLSRTGEKYPAVVVNPPRGGLHRRLPAVLQQLGVVRLAYISCDPATLARDLGRLAGRGFSTVKVTPYDLFPQTAGVEAVARLQADPLQG